MHQEAKFSLRIITLNSDQREQRRERGLGGIFIIQACERCYLLFAFAYRAKVKTKLYNPKSAQNSEALGKGSFCDAPLYAQLKVKGILFISTRDELVEMRECEFTVETRNIVASETKKFVSIYRMTRYFSSNIEL